jgi:hypothetical protein
MDWRADCAAATTGAAWDTRHAAGRCGCCALLHAASLQPALYVRRLWGSTEASTGACATHCCMLISQSNDGRVCRATSVRRSAQRSWLGACPPTRLETRTKESSECASTPVIKTAVRSESKGVAIVVTRGAILSCMFVHEHAQRQRQPTAHCSSRDSTHAGTRKMVNYA